MIVLYCYTEEHLVGVLIAYTTLKYLFMQVECLFVCIFLLQNAPHSTFVINNAFGSL